MTKEDEIYMNDLKLRQMEDQDKDDFEFKSEFVNEYINKYKKRYALFGNKAMNIKLVASHSTTSVQNKSLNTTSTFPYFSRTEKLLRYYQQ